MEDRDKDNKIDEETTVTSEGGEQKPDGAAPKSDGDDDYEKICYVCRRPESKAGTMITMPGGMISATIVCRRHLIQSHRAAWISASFRICLI